MTLIKIVRLKPDMTPPKGHSLTTKFPRNPDSREDENREKLISVHPPVLQRSHPKNTPLQQSLLETQIAKEDKEREKIFSVHLPVYNTSALTHVHNALCGDKHTRTYTGPSMCV